MVVVSSSRTFERRLEALGKANKVRLGQAAVRREVAAGTLSLVEALDDARAQGMTVSALLHALPRWGDARTRKTLRRLLISEMRPVGRLTARERRALIRRVLGIGPQPVVKRCPPRVGVATVEDVRAWLEGC